MSLYSQLRQHALRLQHQCVECVDSYPARLAEKRDAVLAEFSLVLQYWERIGPSELPPNCLTPAEYKPIKAHLDQLAARLFEGCKKLAEFTLSQLPEPESDGAVRFRGHLQSKVLVDSRELIVEPCNDLRCAEQGLWNCWPRPEIEGLATTDKPLFKLSASIVSASFAFSFFGPQRAQSSQDQREHAYRELSAAILQIELLIRNPVLVAIIEKTLDRNPDPWRIEKLRLGRTLVKFAFHQVDFTSDFDDGTYLSLSQHLNEFRVWTDDAKLIQPRVIAAPSEKSASRRVASTTSPSIPAQEELLSLLSVYTNGVIDEKLVSAARVLKNEQLSLDEKLWQIDKLMPFPPTASSRQLGDLFGVTHTAIQNTSWWDQNRRGETDELVARRKKVHTKRAQIHHDPAVTELDT